MDRLDVSTVVYVPPERACEFLLDFPGYAGYTEYLEEVRQFGDGTAETRYDLVLSWWLLSYTFSSEVTDVERPERIDWYLEDLDVEGSWLVEELPEEQLDGHDAGSRIRLRADVDRDALSGDNLDLPRFVSAGMLLDRLVPVARGEVKTILKRIVADLEDEPRPVELTIHDLPAFVQERRD